MRFAIISAFLVVALAFQVSAIPAHAEITWFSDPHSRVLTVTDVTPAGRALPQPSAEAPAYYRAITYGCDYGSLPGDKIPGTKTMTKFVVKILRQQHYHGADDTHAPTLFLAFQWGYLRGSTDQKLVYLGGSKFGLMWATRGNAGNVLPWMLRERCSADEMKVLSMAEESELYVLTISAFDFESVEVRNKPELLWQTRIACAADGAYMTDALPRLAIAGAPFIGRETTAPAWKRPEDGPTARVEIGEPEVLGVEDPAP